MDEWPIRDPVVYADQLISQGHGLPLWCPRPMLRDFSGPGREAHIGDVGHIRRGQFCPIFNVTRPLGDPLNASASGMPPGFVPLPYDKDAPHTDIMIPLGAFFNGEPASENVSQTADGSVLISSQIHPRNSHIVL